MPNISVIVPVYNVERFLARCLDSILGQNLHDIEVICVDDGSPDDSIRILRSYAARDARIKIIRQENRGLGGARNTGIEAASGEYIGFVDSDDWVDSDFYEKLYDAAMRTGADIACASLISHRGEKIKKRIVYDAEHIAESVQDRFETGQCPPSFYVVNKIYRRNILQDGGVRFREHVVLEDVEFTAKAVYAAGRMVTVPGTAYRYMFNSSSIVNSRQTPKKQRDKYEAFRSMLSFADSHGISIPRRYRLITVRTYSVGPVCLLKIKERDGVRFYRLFDFLPVWRRRLP